MACNCNKPKKSNFLKCRKKERASTHPKGQIFRGKSSSDTEEMNTISRKNNRSCIKSKIKENSIQKYREFRRYSMVTSNETEGKLKQ